MLVKAGLAEWLNELHKGRNWVDLLGSSQFDDVTDPIGGPLRVRGHGRRRSSSYLGPGGARLAVLNWARTWTELI